MSALERAESLFHSKFGSKPSIVVAAPGRVNLIGEHTDYNDGFVMPVALDSKRTVVVGRKSADGTCRVMTEAEGVGAVGMVEFPVTAEALKQKDPKWATYIKGVVYQFLGQQIPAFECVVATDVPLGGGLSSSAALEVAMFTFLETLTGKTHDKTQKALLCQKVEHEFVGLPCGIMDQFISVMGVKNHALLIDCRSQQSTPVPLLDPGLAILVTNSNVKHELTGSEYSERKAQCQKAVEVLKQHLPAAKSANVTALRDVTLEELESVRQHMDDVVYRRARHVIGENDRTVQAAEAFKKNDYTTVGKLMVQSHNSLRDDYEVSCKELDILVELCVGEPGVFGARMTGGGFGGCIVTLIEAKHVDALVAKINAKYPEKTGIKPTCFATLPGDGAQVIHQ